MSNSQRYELASDLENVNPVVQPVLVGDWNLKAVPCGPRPDPDPPPDPDPAGEFIGVMQIAAIIEVGENWDDTWYFATDQDWDRFVRNVAERMEYSPEDLSDPVIRQKFDYILICVGHAFLVDGLMKRRGSFKRPSFIVNES